ncbi:MAG: D-alanyl-D-alanine carboxypeptidase family protein, partial [Synechocystis sp.]
MGNKPNSPPSFNPNQGDIPEVIRDQPVSSSSSLLPWRGLIAGGIGVGVVAIMALILLLPR